MKENKLLYSYFFFFLISWWWIWFLFGVLFLFLLLLLLLLLLFFLFFYFFYFFYLLILSLQGGLKSVVGCFRFMGFMGCFDLLKKKGTRVLGCLIPHPSCLRVWWENGKKLSKANIGRGREEIKLIVVKWKIPYDLQFFLNLLNYCLGRVFVW